MVRSEARWPFPLLSACAASQLSAERCVVTAAPGLDNVSEGLVRYELCRVDGSVGTIFGVHSGLAMGSISLLGSAEQKRCWLPAMARMERSGAFC